LAVTECAPAASDEVVKLAEPPANATVPSAVVPSLNVTLPVGVPTPGATTLTVVLKVTAWPNTDGLSEELTVVAVFAGLIVSWNTVAGLLPVKLASPPYVVLKE